MFEKSEWPPAVQQEEQESTATLLVTHAVETQRKHRQRATCSSVRVALPRARDA